MDKNPLVVVPILFVLSLLAAVLLFKFFKSTAVIKTKEYRAGGAIGGFIIVFLMLFFSFSKLGGYRKTIDEDEKQIHNLRERLKPLDIKGTLGSQYRSNSETKLVLAVQAAEANPDGTFHLFAPGINPDKTMVAVYVVSEGRIDRYEVDSSDDLSHWKIPKHSQ